MPRARASPASWSALFSRYPIISRPPKRCSPAGTHSSGWPSPSERRTTFGTAIADLREVQLNGRVNAELMKAKLGPSGDRLPRLLHLPNFANSEVHAPLQIADPGSVQRGHVLPAPSKHAVYLSARLAWAFSDLDLRPRESSDGAVGVPVENAKPRELAQE